MPNSRTLPTPKKSSLVTFTLMIDGEAISKVFGITSITVIKEVNRIPSAHLVIQDGDASKEDFEAGNEAIFAPGKEIDILVGYQSAESSIFKGLIIKFSIKIKRSGASMLILECKDAAVKLTVGPKNKYFIDKSDSEVIEEIIDEYGLDNEVESTAVQHKDLVQYYATDWDFILSRVEVNGKICLVNDGTITVKEPSMDGDPLLDLLYGATILDFDATIDARDQYQAVKAFSWDPASQSILEVDGTDPAISGNGNLNSADLASVIDLGHLNLSHTGSLAQDELQAWADSQFLKSQLAKTRGRVGFYGYAEIKPGDLILLQGLGERMNGKVFVSGIRHEISNGTWKTDAQFGLHPEWFSQKYAINQMPASGLLPAVQGLQIGLVIQLQEDPDGEDRILVKLPIISNEESGIWARVACLDAGNNRGSVFRPEIGDEVVLGFLNNDPRDPIILGGLNSSSMPSPIPGADENHEKGFVSRSEMKIIFNDDKKSLLLETPAGKQILLDEDGGILKLEDENGNRIIMDGDGIIIESKKKIILKTVDDVEIEGKNIKNTAQASFKADGSAGIELTSSAIAKLKGSLVQIN